MNEEPEKKEAPPARKADEGSLPADCRVLKHRARIAGVQLARDARVALPMDMARAMEAAGLVEIVGVAAAK